MSKGVIVQSQFESDLFGLRVGRLSADEVCTSMIRNDLIRCKYDVLRLHVPADDSRLELKLNQVGIPFYLSGIVQRFVIDFSNYELKPMINEFITFEPYSQSKRMQFFDSIKKCFLEEAGGFFEIPYLRKIVSPHKQVQALIGFLLGQVENHPSRYLAWAALVRGEFAGFIIITVDGSTGETLLAGVDPIFRNQRIFTDITRFIQNFSKDFGLKLGYAGARVQNQISQKLFLREGMTVEQTFMIYYFLPLFTYQEQNVNLRESTGVRLGTGVGGPICAYVDHLETQYPGRKVELIRHLRLTNFPPDRVSSFIIEEQQSDLVASSLFDSENRVCGSSWIVLEKEF